MKIAIVGAGAMGSRFGYMLSKNGKDVIFIDTWKENVHEINTNGLKVDINGKEDKVHIPTFFPEEIKELPDLVILFTKSMGLVPMLESLKGAIGEDTKFLCLLNGLGHEETLEKYIPKKNIFMGVTLWTAGLAGPGNAILHGDGSIDIQNIDASSKKECLMICDILSESGLKANYSHNVLLSIWRKACVNGALNCTCTLLDCNVKSFAELSISMDVVKKIVREFIQVAEARNIILNFDEVIRYIEKTFDPREAGEHYPSMHQDLIQNHRFTEINYINGFVAKKGKELEIPTPYNTLLTELIYGKEQLIIKL